MSKIYELLLVGTVFFGLYAGIILLFVSKQNRLQNRLLAGIMLVYSLFFFLIFCANRSWSPELIVLFRTFTPFYYFLPALMYLYIRSFIRDDWQLTRKDLWHLLPFGLHIIYMSPLIAGILTGDPNWQTVIGTVNQTTYFFNGGPLPDRYHVLFRLGLMLFYLFHIWNLFLGRHFRVFLAKNREIYPQAIRWISYFVLVITANAAFALFLKIRIFFQGSKTGLVYGDIVTLGLLMTLDLLIAYALLNPVVLYGLPQFKRFADEKAAEPKIITDSSETEPVLQPAEEPAEVGSEAEKEIAADELEKMELLIARMNDYVAMHHPYRQPEFNIRELSRKLQIPEHHLAYIFRHYLNKSFVNYRNELRVQYVMDVLKKGMPKELTIESIGTDAGFSSRTTFFIAFKKHTGMTPTQYLKKLEDG